MAANETSMAKRMRRSIGNSSQWKMPHTLANANAPVSVHDEVAAFDINRHERVGGQFDWKLQRVPGAEALRCPRARGIWGVEDSAPGTQFQIDPLPTKGLPKGRYQY